MTDPAPTSIAMPPPEPRRTRLLGLLLALALAGGFLLAAVAFDPPAHGGVDENGYLTGGKLLARHGTMAFRPAGPDGDFDPFQFVGRMWVAADAGTDRETYYPKYPAGFPLLVAAALKLGGAGAVYLVNPVAAALAVLGTFFLGRHLGGTLPGLLAAVCFATSLTTIQCATDPNSHATAACCGVWGLYWLLLWLRGGGTAVAFAAGLAFGYAATIRYTEGLLILPLLWVAVVRGGAFRGTGVPPASAASPSGPEAEGNPGGTPVPRDGRPRGTGVPPASAASPSGPVAEGNPGGTPAPREGRPGGTGVPPASAALPSGPVAEGNPGGTPAPREGRPGGTGVPPASAALPSGPVAEGNPGGTPAPREGRPGGTGVPPASAALPSGPVAEGNPGGTPAPREGRPRGTGVPPASAALPSGPVAEGNPGGTPAPREGRPRGTGVPPASAASPSGPEAGENPGGTPVPRDGRPRGTGVPPTSSASPSGPVAEGNPGGTPVPRDGRPRGTGVPPASAASPSGPVAEGNPGGTPVPRGWQSALFALLGWAIPVAALAAFNLATMGHLTGYANGGESADFRLTFFASNWDVVLRQLSVGGLFLVFPIGLAGLGAMFWWDWRTAGALALALVPCLLTYASYYWAPVGAFDDVRYLRFFLGTLPAISAAGFWWVRRGREWAGGPGRRLEPGESRWVGLIAVAAGVLFTVLVLRYGRDQKLSPDGYSAIHFVHDAKLALARPLRQWPALLTFGAAVLTAGAAAAAVGAAAFARRGAAAVLVGGGAAFLAVAVGAQGGTEALRPDQAERLAKAEASEVVLNTVPRGAVVFCDERSLLQHLQFAGDFTLYGLEAFDARTYDGYAKELRKYADAPQADDPLRRAAAVGRLGGWDQKRLGARARQIIADALRAGRPVYFVNTLTARTYAAAARDWRSPALPKWFAAFADPKQFRTERVAAWTVSDVMPAPDRHEPKSRRGWADPWPAVLRGDSGGRIYAVGLRR